MHAGGITHVRRIADFAALYQVRTGFHGATDLSPVCMAAAVNFDLWVPNFGIQELMPHAEVTDEVFPHSYRFEDGYLVMDEVPGLGVDIDESARRSIRTSAHICRSRDCATAQCGIGSKERLMLSVVVEQPNQMAVCASGRSRTPAVGEVRVRVRYAGICGSDVHILHGKNPFVVYPRVIGHEFVGRIDAVGEGVDRARLDELVAVDPVISCGRCHALPRRSAQCLPQSAGHRRASRWRLQRIHDGSGEQRVHDPCRRCRRRRRPSSSRSPLPPR